MKQTVMERMIDVQAQYYAIKDNPISPADIPMIQIAYKHARITIDQIRAIPVNGTIKDGALECLDNIMEFYAWAVETLEEYNAA